MKGLKFAIISILLFSGTAFSDDTDSINYIGSFSKLRYSAEHAYISEVWLWQHKDKIIGLYLDGSKLQGDSFHYIINKIEKSSGNIGTDLSFNTKYYDFKGKFNPLSIEGVLRKGSEIVWGGIEGSNIITLTKGTNIKKIKNPEGSYKTYSSWLNWVASQSAPR